MQQTESAKHVKGFTAEMTDLVAVRGAAYGTPQANFENIAIGWNVLIANYLAPGEQLSPRDVAKMLVWLKLARDMTVEKHDNMVDAANFALIADQVSGQAELRGGDTAPE